MRIVLEDRVWYEVVCRTSLYSPKIGLTGTFSGGAGELSERRYFISRRGNTMVSMVWAVGEMLLRLVTLIRLGSFTIPLCSLLAHHARADGSTTRAFGTGGTRSSVLSVGAAGKGGSSQRHGTSKIGFFSAFQVVASSSIPIRHALITVR